MERVIVASLRGTFCTLMLAGLAACGNGSESDTTTPVSQQPTQPSNPTTPSDPTEPSTPSQPSTPSNPTQPSDPTDPSEEPTTPEEPPVVGDSNVAPQIVGSPANEVVVGQSFNFTPNATDADGDDLTFSIASKPAWATFDSNTGHLWGTPDASDVGSHEEITISVSDGEHTRTLPQFAVNVVEQTNGSATLAWQPPTQNTDGSALTNLRGYKIHYGTTPGNYDQTLTVDSAGISSFVIENLASGTYYFAISAIATNGTESDLSHEASKTI